MQRFAKLKKGYAELIQGHLKVYDDLTDLLNYKGD